MLVLVVDTAGSTGGVLLARNESVAHRADEAEVLGEILLEPRKFSTQLVSGVAELLQQNRSALADLDAFAVVSGPGSFTGLRVGLSAIKAMAEVTAKPVISLSRLVIMASMAKACNVEDSACGLVHAVADAGRGEFYHGIYRDAGWTCVAESLQTLDSFAASLNSCPGVIVASEPAVLAALNAMSNVAPCEIACATARDALPLVLAAWQAQRFSDVALLDANYLRHIEPAVASRADVPVGGL